MAVYTAISDTELTPFIAQYAVGEIVSYHGISEGVENSNYLVQTTEGNYILTLYEKRVVAEDIPFFLGLLGHLANAGIHCPTPVADKNGVTLKELCGRPAALVDFLDGVWMRRPLPQHCSKIGATLAAMHNAALDFSGYRENALSVKNWRSVFNAACATGDHAAGEISINLQHEIVRELDDLEARWPGDLPSGIIHADLFPDNVFFLNNKVSGIIDFYFACNDMLAYDVAVCLNAWCFEPDMSFNTTKARALISGYNRVRPLTDGEYAALPVLARGAALRFFLTRLYDWRHPIANALVNPKDPHEYLRKLRFHRTASSVAAYGIDNHPPATRQYGSA